MREGKGEVHGSRIRRDGVRKDQRLWNSGEGLGTAIAQYRTELQGAVVAVCARRRFGLNWKWVRWSGWNGRGWFLWAIKVVRACAGAEDCCSLKAV